MNAVIVYESAWGNTKAVAEAVAEGLGDHATTHLVSVEDAASLSDLVADLVVVGAPTHAFGLSRERTRKEAHDRGGELVTTGVRDWLDRSAELADGRVADRSVAAFDTHVRHPNLPGWASHSAAKKLGRLGCTMLAKPESFFVDGYEGPLLPGELDRARHWGSVLGTRLLEIPGAGR